MNKIDLSKIPVKETAKSTVKANFGDGEKDYEIRALNDGEKTNLISLLASGKDVFRTRNLYVCLISCGLDIEQREAEVIFDNCTPEAVKVGDAVFELSKIFLEAQTAEAAEAEKN